MEELKKRYEEAMGKKNTIERIISKMENHQQLIHTKVLQMVQTTKQSLHRLDEITLKPNPFTKVEYIELLIRSEKQECRPGWQQRIKCYEEMKQQAMLLKAVSNEGEITRMLPSNSLWEKLKFW